MSRHIRALLASAAIALLAAAPAQAQSTLPPVPTYPGSGTSTGSSALQVNGAAVSATNPLPTAPTAQAPGAPTLLLQQQMLTALGTPLQSGGPVITKPTSLLNSVTPVTVGTTSALALAASPRIALAIDNESTTATMACAFGVAAALNAAGSFTIPPGVTRTWSGTFVPADAINCIASASGTPATFQAN